MEVLKDRSRIFDMGTVMASQESAVFARGWQLMLVLTFKWWLRVWTMRNGWVKCEYLMGDIVAWEGPVFFVFLPGGE